MSGEGETPDKLRALRDGVAAAASPAERVEAALLLAQ